MGKEWLFWGGGGGGGGGGGKSSKKGRSSSGGAGGAEREAATAAAAAPRGCMCAVLQLFDLHHLPFALHHQPFKPGSFLQDEPTIRKGLEAPRNSLELEEPFKEATADSLSSTMKQQQQNLNMPVNIQIRTSCENKSPRASISKARTDDLLSECSSNSPGAKTPTLVARLMGLDQLPESSTSSAGSPSLHSSSTLNSLTNLHMHPQGQSQRGEQSPISRQHVQSRSYSNYYRGFLDNEITTGTLSLPETPRISSARRSDVEHRLSLQINKENIGEEFEFSAYTAKRLARRISESKREDENSNTRGGRYYARQIVKQVKESVSRKVGLDITNTIKSREQQRRDDIDDHVVLLKPKKPSNNKVVSTRLLLGDESSQSKQSTPSCSPRLLEYPKNKPPVTKAQSSQYSPRLSPLSTSPESHQSKPKPQAVPVVTKEQPNHQQNSALKKCKRDASEKYNSRLKKPPRVSEAIRNKKEEPFIRSATTNKGNGTDKKCKKTPLSNELLNISTTVPTILPVKKDIPFRASKLGDKQSQASDAETWRGSTQILSSCSSQSYKQQQKKGVTHTLTFQENIQDRHCNGSSTPDTSASTSRGDEASAEYQYYIQRILKRTGIDKSTPVSLAKWYSPSHPLDPSIFHYIELFHPTTITPFSTSANPKLILRCNRRLVFQLVDELLADILKPYLSLKPCCLHPRGQMCGSELIDALCSGINKFPSANCQVLEDIDALVDTDLRSKSFQLGKESYDEAEEEEAEGIVLEIGREILESLVHETAMEVAYG